MANVIQAFVLGTGAISPQRSWAKDFLFDFPSSVTGDRMYCDEPDYAQYIDPRHLRRMSRILRMGTAASAIALQEAGIKIPDGIITGTGYGCLEDTISFMEKMVKQNEYALSPTPFIQSTHNTIGSQIALLIQCQGYNQTYTQDALSFESALLDALLSLNENPDRVILTGGVDEITDVSHAIQKRFGIYRKTLVSSLSLFESPGHGTLHGEGAFYFALSGTKGERAAAAVVSLTTFLNVRQEKVAEGILQFLDRANLTPDAIDLLLLGKNGDIESDMVTAKIVEIVFKSVQTGLFKHLSGEYPTASAFALWLAVKIMETQKIPEIVLKSGTKKKIKNILIYNPWFGQSHSLILLQAC